MPHLITSPLVSPSDKSRCASVGNKKRSSTDPSQGASLATIISPEKEKGSAEAERGRDDRELAAMQTMLELPNMPPSPQSNTNAVSSDSAHMRNETPPPTSGHVCYDARPPSFVPFRSYVTVWVINASGLQIKWCKGCKNFRPWAAFGEKGGATKCMKCRERQKEKYASQKSRSEEPTKKRKIDDSIEVDSTESKIIMISDEINNRKLVTEQREDNENEEDDPNQLQW